FPAPVPTNMVHRVGDELIPGFPWTFPALSALPYALFGPAGLRLLPMGAFFALALAMAWLGWRSRWGGVAVGAAVVATSIACPLVLYASMFWEHSPATLLCFAGFLEVALPQRPSRRPWLRPAMLGAC